MNRILEIAILLCATSVFAQPFTHSELGWRKRPVAAIPTEPPPENLATWLRADAGVYSNLLATVPSIGGGIVGSWIDQSGNGIDVLANEINQPIFLENQQNGLPAIRFGSTSLTSASNSFNDAAYIAVVRYHVTNNVPSVYAYTTPLASFIDAGKNDTNGAYLQTSGGYISGGIISTGAFHIITWITGSNAAIRIDGVEVASGIVTNNFTEALTVGGGIATLNHSDVGEVVRYQDEVSLSVIQLVEAYLRNKWGL